MSPQQHRSDLEGRTPLVFENIQAYPSKLHEEINFMFRDFINFSFKVSENNEREEEVPCLINVRMVYLGQEANL